MNIKILILSILTMFMLSGCVSDDYFFVDQVTNDSLWSFIQDNQSTNIQYPNTSTASGNVTIHNFLSFGDNATLNNNGTCFITTSPNGVEQTQLCNNGSFHVISNGIRALDINDTIALINVFTNINNTIVANGYTGDGGGLFNVSFNASAANLSGVVFWKQGVTNIVYYDDGNVTVNNSFRANNITYPLVDGKDGDVVVSDGKGQLMIQTFLLSQIADYDYDENETERSFSGTGVSAVGLFMPVNVSGGFYRAQAYLELKTSTNNKAVVVFIGVDNLVNESLTTVNTPLGNAYQFVSPFASNINLSAGLHNLTISLLNLDNTLTTFRRVRMEIMKVSETSLIS